MGEYERSRKRSSWLRPLTLGTLVVGVTAAAVGTLGLACDRHPSAQPAPQRSSPDLSYLCRHRDVPDRAWRYIVIHHSATVGGGAATFERYHIGVRGWDSLAYHFVIGNGTQTGDGEIEVGSRWPEQRGGPGAGALEYNEWGIAICLVGDFSKQRPTRPQMRSLHALVRYLMQRYDIAPNNVLGHGECPGAATECPGRNFPMEEFRRSLR